MPPVRSSAANKPQPWQHHPSSLPAIAEVADCRTPSSRTPRFRVVISIGFAVALLIGQAVRAEPIATSPSQFASDPFAASVTEAALRSGIPASWIRAVMQVESGGDVRAVSPKGAMGLMQIMPETWASLRLRYGLGADPFDPHDNILAGAAYLRELHDRYGSPGFLAAYNAGPARYEDHIATGRPLPTETRAYVAVLAPQISSGAIDGTVVVAIAARPWTDAPLFSVQSGTHSATAQATSDPQTGRPATGDGPQDLTALAPQSEGLFVRTSRRNRQP